MVRPTGQGRPVPPGGQTKTENPGFSLPYGPGRPGWSGLGGSGRFRAAPGGFRPSVLISKMMSLAGRGRPEPPVLNYELASHKGLGNQSSVEYI